MRAVAKLKRGTRIRTGTERRRGLGRAGKRRKIARKRLQRVDAVWEIREVWTGRERKETR